MGCLVLVSGTSGPNLWAQFSSGTFIHNCTLASMSPSVPQTPKARPVAPSPVMCINHSLKATQLSWGIGKVRVLQSGYVGMCVPTIGTLEAEGEDTFWERVK